MPAAKKLAAAASIAAFSVPAAAQGQTPGSNDPAGSSPPGVVYEIPLERGRDDAAPRDRSGESAATGGGGTASGAPSAGGSSIRSDNGFGSSSVVPGAQARPQPGAGSAGGRRAGGSRGTGSGGGGSAPASDAERLIPTKAASASPSLPRALLLLALGVVVAAALGAGAWRAARGD